MPRPPAQTLPGLLSSLPSSSSSSHTTHFIRPISFPPTSYYAITRSSLKFTPVSVLSEKSTAARPGRNVGTTISRDEGLKNESGDMGEIKVSGKAWGRSFWDGKYVSPRSKLAKLDTLIHGGSKRKWVVVDPDTIPSSVMEELRSSRGGDEQIYLLTAQ